MNNKTTIALKRKVNKENQADIKCPLIFFSFNKMLLKYYFIWLCVAFLCHAQAYYIF